MRPGLIGGERAQLRSAERLAGRVLHALGPLLPRRYRINPAVRVAAALVEQALQPRAGRHVIGSEQLT